METQEQAAPPARNCIANLLRSVTIEHLWAVVVIVGIFVFLNTHPIRPHDFWWHMAVGREIATTWHIPTVDTYSHTAAGVPYPSYQAFWLPELLLYGAYTLGGPALTVFLHSLVITAAYAVLLWLSAGITGNWRIAALSTLFAAALGINDWNVRPQALTFAVAACYLLAIERYRRTVQRRWLALFPAGMLLWVNSHGAFPLGLGIIGLWLADEGWRALLELKAGAAALKRLAAPAAVLGATLCACLANPRGAATFSYVTGMSANPVIRNLVAEWAPPTFASLTGKLFLLALLGTAALLALSPKRPTPFQILAFGAFGLLGLNTVRGAIWFGIVTAPTVADHLAHLMAALRRLLASRFGAAPAPAPRPRPVLNALFLGALLLGALLTLPWLKARLPLPAAKAGLISSETPIAATDYLLQAQPPGLLFHAMPYGSYLIWAAQPNYPVFVDSRIELYPPEVWLDYLAISAAEAGWEARLADYGVQTLFLSYAEQPALIAAVEDATGWRPVYQDSVAVIYTRDPH